MKIGLPDTVRYQRYGAWWEGFLRTLGAEVVTPQLPLADALEEGERLMPGEPPTIQLLVGRVLEIAPAVDALLVPDLNPGAEPGARAGSADPWAVDLGAVLSRRLSLPPLHAVPARLEPAETPGLAVRLGQTLAQNPQMVRRALDRTQAAIKPARHAEPMWARAGRATVGVAGDPVLLEQPFLWRAVSDALERHGLHAVIASDLPRERALEVGRQRRPDLRLETDLEAVGGAFALEGRGQVRGLVVLTQPRAPIGAALGADIARRAHKPAITLEAGAADLDARLGGFKARL